MKILRLNLSKQMHEELQTLSFKQGRSFFALVLDALQQFIAQAKARGEL